MQPQNSVTDLDDAFDTISMSTIDETNNSSTNSIITEINNGSIADGDFSEPILSNLEIDDLFETQTIRGSVINGDNDEYTHQQKEMVNTREINIFQTFVHSFICNGILTPNRNHCRNQRSQHKNRQLQVVTISIMMMMTMMMITLMKEKPLNLSIASSKKRVD